MPDEEEFLLLPCMPLTNDPGDNPESDPDLWIFDVKSSTDPDLSVTSDLSPVRIDYVHPGVCVASVTVRVRGACVSGNMKYSFLNSLFAREKILVDF